MVNDTTIFEREADLLPLRELSRSGGIAFNSRFAASLAVFFTLCLIIMLLPYINGDLFNLEQKWIAKALSVNTSIKLPEISNSYLFTVVYGGWYKFNEGNIASPTMARLPGVIIALFTVYFMFFSFRKIFHHVSAAIVATLTLCFSPMVVQNISSVGPDALMLLTSTIFSIGVIEFCLQQRTKTGFFYVLLGIFAVPAASLSGILVVILYLAFIFVYLTMKKALWQNLVYVVALNTALLATLFIFLDPFIDACYNCLQPFSKLAWTQLTNWVFALLTHGGIVLALMCCFIYSHRKKYIHKNGQVSVHSIIKVFSIFSILIILILPLIFILPKSFPLLLIPIWTFVILYFWRSNHFKINKHFYYLLLICLGNVLAFNNFRDVYLRQELRTGNFPKGILADFRKNNHLATSFVNFMLFEQHEIKPQLIWVDKPLIDGIRYSANNHNIPPFIFVAPEVENVDKFNLLMEHNAIKDGQIWWISYQSLPELKMRMAEKQINFTPQLYSRIGNLSVYVLFSSVMTQQQNNIPGLDLDLESF
ncbi:MAG: glycosyltransferase family 39 protein [Lentisphaeria bacterium]|nr:glycosyltransferase family 39 protein [Lentisphaeria bacterium]